MVHKNLLDCIFIVVHILTLVFNAFLIHNFVMGFMWMLIHMLILVFINFLVHMHVVGFTSHVVHILILVFISIMVHIYPHWFAIALAIPLKARLLSVEFLGVSYQPLVYLLPFFVVMYVTFTILVGFNFGRFLSHRQVFFE